MSKIWGRRPSPSLVISLLALFVALGGSAYAASKIGSKDIKKNAITAAKIKKNAVTTAKIKNNAVTGAKVKESSLGPVPSADSASTAASAQNFSRFSATGLKKLSIGQTTTLLTIGPFTLTAKCADKGGGLISAKAYLTTTQVGSSMYSSGGDNYYEANFNPGTEAQVGDETYNNNPSIGWEDTTGYYTGFRAASGDGATLLEGEVVKGILVYGAQCVYWASVMNVG